MALLTILNTSLIDLCVAAYGAPVLFDIITQGLRVSTPERATAARSGDPGPGLGCVALRAGARVRVNMSGGICPHVGDAWIRTRVFTWWARFHFLMGRRCFVSPPTGLRFSSMRTQGSRAWARCEVSTRCSYLGNSPFETNQRS